MRLVMMFLLLIALAVSSVQATEINLFPDPSFEKSGNSTEARTGQRAGSLVVTVQNRWSPMAEVRLKLEPFATYRATGYAKGYAQEGSLLALYVYSWNSFDWTFNADFPVTSKDNWQAVEITFTSPDGNAVLIPLVFTQASNGKGWIDDVSVIKIKTATETIRELAAKSEKTQQDLQLLARYYYNNKNMAAVNNIIQKADTSTKADLACFIALKTKNKPARIPYIIDMVRYNGMSRNNADTRINEMTADFSASEKGALAVKLAAQLPGNVSAAKACVQLAQPPALSADQGMTTVQMTSVIRAAQTAAAAMTKAFMDNQETKAIVEPALAKIEIAKAELDYRLAHKGTKKLLLAGKTIGTTTHLIVIPKTPTLQEKYAAKDFQNILEQITGSLVPIRNEDKSQTKPAIYIGKTSKAIKAGVNFQKLGLEGTSIKTVGPSLVLAGNKRGVLYACYSFLEDYLGCRWFTPDCTVIPNTGSYKIAAINKTYIPALEHRSTDYPHSCNQYWAVRNMINGYQPNIDEERGNSIRYVGFVHTFNSLVPPDKYFAEHPEYYSEIGGVRIGPGMTQLCLTNPEVLKIATETVRQWFRENPQASIVSVSQNDWWYYCQCAKCTALAEKEGSQSGPLIHFVNAIADAVKQEFPDKIIDTLAYQYTRKPPKLVKPRSNVVVRLCSIECCFVHPLETCPFNASFRQDTQDWSKIHKRMWMWDYVINYAHSIMPFPNLYSLKPNINFYINNGITGIYEEANYYSKGGELAELRTWIMAKTLWNPKYDTDKAIDEFLPAYYGKASGPIRAYINLIHRKVKDNPDNHITIYTGPAAGNLTDDIIKRSNELFDEAENAVKNDDNLLHRVQVARLPIIYTMIAQGYDGYVESGNELIVPKSRADGGLAAEFEKIARKEGVTMISEGNSLDKWLNGLQKQGQPISVLKLENAAMSLSVLPAAGGRIWKMTYLPNNKEMMRVYGKPDALQPRQGGYEEFSELGYRTPGWSEVYSVFDQTPSSVRLETTLESGLKISRIISLEQDRPLVNIKTTLTNTSAVSLDAGIRVHPEFAAADVNKGYLAVRTQGNTWKLESLSSEKEPDSAKEIWLRGDSVPAGGWAFIDADGSALVNRFNRDQVDLAYVNYFGGGSRYNLELFPKTNKLAPGQSIALEHSYEVLPDAQKALGIQ